MSEMVLFNTQDVSFLTSKPFPGSRDRLLPRPRPPKMRVREEFNLGGQRVIGIGDRKQKAKHTWSNSDSEVG